MFNHWARRLSMVAVLAVRGGSTPSAEPALVAELTALVAEWQRTVDALAAVPTAEIPDADEWAYTLAAATERVEVYQQRL
ncbi:MAG TPA: hypothetical protein PLV68_04240, partial [Ilumatobacteraceae bacterium]|nr:hypothetical protein [Ilumatobacteraceae bacterium]